jgi:hypothetical protein
LTGAVFRADPPGTSGAKERGREMYIGVGTVLLIVLIILLVAFLT